MDKSNIKKLDLKALDLEVKELQKLISWHEYYSLIDNVILANKCQKEIESKKKEIDELRKTY